VRWRGNTLWGFIEVLDTPSGRLIKHLYSRGCKLGVSSRGWASLRELPGKDYKCIMDNFELITFDFVTEPSTRGAWLLPYAGSYHPPVPQQPFAEAVSRLGVGAVLPAQFPTLPSIRETLACLQEYRVHLREVRCCICKCFSLFELLTERYSITVVCTTCSLLPPLRADAASMRSSLSV
jgi:hypothetical protein